MAGAPQAFRRFQRAGNRFHHDHGRRQPQSRSVPTPECLSGVRALPMVCSPSTIRVEVFPVQRQLGFVRQLPDYADHHRRGHRVSVRGGLIGAHACQGSDAVPADDRVHQRSHPDRPEDGHRPGDGAERSGGINCGTACSRDGSFRNDVPSDGHAGSGIGVHGWTGCTSVNAQNQCSVTLNQSITVTANFAQPSR